MGIPRYETRKVVLAKFKTCLVRSAAAKIVDLREDFMGPTHRQFKCVGNGNSDRWGNSDRLGEQLLDRRVARRGARTAGCALAVVL